MNPRLRVIAVVLLLASIGCVSRDTGGLRKSYSRYLRVHPSHGQVVAYALERSVNPGDTFARGSIVLYGHPRENMALHRLGALPATYGMFSLWDGRDPTNAPLPKARGVSIPVTGGPWRGVVVELHARTRYPAEVFTPVPGQPHTRRAGPVVTEVLYCDTANILACVPWADAVLSGWVTCETAHRVKLLAHECLGYVPRTEWNVSTRP